MIKVKSQKQNQIYLVDSFLKRKEVTNNIISKDITTLIYYINYKVAKISIRSEDKFKERKLNIFS
ncbi:MAG: hypothetical protein QXN16_01140 [Candidatus Micrarchaeaceae archaeon]